jgi:hypothetical protein
MIAHEGLEEVLEQSSGIITRTGRHRKHKKTGSKTKRKTTMKRGTNLK